MSGMYKVSVYNSELNGYVVKRCSMTYATAYWYAKKLRNSGYETRITPHYRKRSKRWTYS